MKKTNDPLKIHELNIPAFTRKLAEQGIWFTTSPVRPLFPAQEEIVSDPARFKVIVAGRRFSKSIVCALIACAVMMQPNRRIWILSDTYDLTDKVFREVYRIFVQELEVIKKGKSGKASMQHRYIETPWGSRIEGKSCENRNSLVGESLDLVIWDEVARTKQAKDIWNQEIRPCLVDREGSVVFISTPSGKHNFLYELYLLGNNNKHKEWKSFKYTSYANTIEQGGYLPKKEIDLAKLTTPDLKFRQEYLADFEAVSDAVFSNLEEEVQYVDYKFDPSNGPVYATMDFNYSTPCTTLFAQVDANNNIMFFDEFCVEKTTIHEQARQLLQWNNDMKLKYKCNKDIITNIVADIAGEQKGLNGRSAWDDLADWGIYPVGRKQDIETGLDLIRLWMAYPLTDNSGSPILEKDETEEEKQVRINKLFVSKNCPVLWKALNAAKFKQEKQTGILKNCYIKDGITDGPLDAMRYLFVYLFHDSKYLKGLIPVRF